MKKISIRIPSSIKIEQLEIQEAIAVVFYHQKRISEFQACQILGGISRRDFEELLPKYGFSILSDDQHTIDKELRIQ